MVNPHVFTVTAVSTYQLENTAEAVNPVPTERLATMNISEWSLSSERYLFWMRTATRIMRQNNTDRPIMMP